MDLRQGTSVVITFGPALSPTDGVTPVATLASALDNAATGIRISKNGNASIVRNAVVSATNYDANGDYRVTLSAVDTNTLGRLRVKYTDPLTTGPMWADYMVLTAAAYDALYT